MVQTFYFATFSVEYFFYVLQLLLSFIPEPKSLDDFVRDSQVSHYYSYCVHNIYSTSLHQKIRHHSFLL